MLDAGADPFQAGVETQGAAEAFQGRGGVAQLQIALTHPGRGGEMIRIDLERFAAIADRFDEMSQAEIRHRAWFQTSANSRASSKRSVAREAAASNCFLVFRRMIDRSRC